MDENAKRFARRILLLHLLALVIVLALVGLAFDEIYNSTRDQVIAQAKSRQELLASQTARGIESYYQYILDNLDLLRKAENDEPTTERAVEARPPTTRPFGGRFGNDVAAGERALASGRSPLVSQILWKQLEGRVCLMFGVDGLAQPGQTPAVRVIGSTAPNPTPSDVIALSHDWLASVKTASVSQFIIYPTGGANLICIPYPRGRFMIAVVPIQAIEEKFLVSLNDDSDTVACLVDEKMTAMAASLPPMAGLSMNEISDSNVRGQFADDILHGRRETELVSPFSIASAAFPASMVSGEPIAVGGKNWELFIFSPTSQVDGILSKLFRRALLWGAIVIICVTALLLSTAWQLIRSRIRLERFEHDLLTRQLSQAREIQLAWLPDQLPTLRAVDVAAINSPANHISGDFYNWFELNDGRLIVTIGDVTGHGMAAAFLMATAQLLVRNTMMRVGDPGKCLEEVNRQLCVQVFNGQFVTMLIAALDLRVGELQLATAGHPPPLFADGESFQPLRIEPQLVLGVDRQATFETQHYALPKQSSLLLYTDGVVDCLSPTGDRFGRDRLQRALYGRYDSAQKMLNHLMTEVENFRGNQELADDLTLVAIQLQPAAGRQPLVRSAAGT
jgi:serine phosphatase RsbU (regulator of sigma subunit)